MKILFLDIDGVIATPPFNKESSNPLFHYGFSPSCVERLNQIVAAAGCEIVISSLWKRMHDWDSLRVFILEQGIKRQPLDKTPDHFSFPRGKEISTWLESNKALNVEKFVIIDDLPVDHFEGLEDHVVTTDFQKGLQEEHIELVLRKLQ